MNEFYYIKGVNKEKKLEQQFVVYKKNNNRWQESIISQRVGTPFISPDGKTMYLGRRYMERIKTGWSEVKKLSSPFENLPIMRLTTSSKGTYFFDEFKRDFTGSIRYSRLVDGVYEEPRLLNDKINSGMSFQPFIAPDESYLIFDSKRERGHGDSDLYISYRLKDGSWGEPINLGDKINTEGWEAIASITPDGKYLFFNRNMTPDNHKSVDLFWVGAKFIDDLRPKL